MQHTATHCNKLQHAATHCYTLLHTATHTALVEGAVQDYLFMLLIATHCNTLPHTATHCYTLLHTATHCYTHCTGRGSGAGLPLYAACCGVSQHGTGMCVLKCVVVCCSVLQCVTVCYSVLQYVAVCCSVLQCVAVCYRVLPCVAVCCSVLQCIMWLAVASHNMAEVIFLKSRLCAMRCSSVLQ